MKFAFKALIFSLVAFGLFTLLSSKSVQCYSFIPYGYSRFYNSLIDNEKVCYYYFNKLVSLKTGPLGERLIPSEKKDYVVAIGESQLLGIDWSDEGERVSHDLNLFYPKMDASIFAAPNNGPRQNLARLDQIPADILSNAQAVVVGFNFSTDIFRVNYAWDHKLSSPIPLYLYEIPLFRGVLFDLFLIYARVLGKKFGSGVPDPKAVLDEYEKIEKANNLDIYFLEMNQLVQKISNYNSNIDLIFFPPYWGIDDNHRVIQSVELDYFEIICRSKNQLNSIRDVYFADIGFKPSDLSADNRHFRQGRLKWNRLISCDQLIGSEYKLKSQNIN